MDWLQNFAYFFTIEEDDEKAAKNNDASDLKQVRFSDLAVSW